jgi:hypothetical protein
MKSHNCPGDVSVLSFLMFSHFHGQQSDPPIIFDLPEK